MRRSRLLAVFGVALAVRLVYVLVLDPRIEPISDAFNYHVLGDLIRHDRGFIGPTDWAFRNHVRPTAVFGPGHPVVLAFGNLLGLDTIRQQQLFMGFVGSFTPVLTALLGWRLTRSQGVALGAGLLAAFDPMLFGSDGALMAETVFTLCGTAVLLLLLASRDRTDARRWWLAAGAGAVLGGAVLTRGDGLLLLPIAVVPLLWRHWRQMVLVGVAMTLVVAPWLVRNYVRFDRVVLSTNIGALVNGANCPESYEGAYLGSWSFECAYRIDLVGDEAVDADRLRAQGIRYAREHAGRVPVVVAARLGRGWGVFQPFTQAEREARFEGRVESTQSVGVVLTWVLVPLALLGVWLLRRRGVGVAPLVCPIVFVTVLFAVSYGNPRFGELARPALAVGAVVALAALPELRAARRSG
jgi:4-amino-4-deoxy-L-arabinose transferase-like glycosyltransferase